MKLKIKKEEILRGLQRIQGVVDKKNTMPILSNMLLIAGKTGVEIIATDLEIGLRGQYAADVEAPGAVAVSAKKMYEIARELPQEDVQILVDDNNWVKIISGQSQFKLVGLPKDEFPALPDVAEEGMIAVEGDVLRNMIRCTPSCIRITRPWMVAPMMNQHTSRTGRSGTVSAVHAAAAHTPANTSACTFLHGSRRCSARMRFLVSAGRSRAANMVPPSVPSPGRGWRARSIDAGPRPRRRRAAPRRRSGRRRAPSPRRTTRAARAARRLRPARARPDEGSPRPRGGPGSGWLRNGRATAPAHAPAPWRDRP